MSGDREYSRGTRVFVGGLTDSVKKEDLEREFEKYGKLNNVWVAFNPPGFGFIEFENRDDAETACDSLNGTEMLGSELKVEIARARRGRGGGGFRGSRGGFRGGRGRDDYGGRGSRGRGGFRSRFDDYGSRSGGYGGGYDRGDKYGGGRDNYGGDSYRSSYRSRSPLGGGGY